MTGESLTLTNTPPAEAGPFPAPSTNGSYAARSGEGLILDPVEFDTSQMLPAPELIAPQPQPEASGAPSEPEAALVPEPTFAVETTRKPEEYSSKEGWQLAENAQGKTYVWREAPGNAYGKETRWIDPAQWSGETDSPRLIASSETTSVETMSEADKDEVIRTMSNRIRQLEDRVAALEDGSPSAEDSSTVTDDHPEPKPPPIDDEISRFIKKRREENLARLEKINTNPSVRFEGAWRAARAALADRAREAAVKAGETTAKAGLPLKAAVSASLQAGQEARSKAWGVAKETGKETWVHAQIYSQIAGEKVSSGWESARLYSRRQTVQVLGAAILMRVSLFGPWAGGEKQPVESDVRRGVTSGEDTPAPDVNSAVGDWIDHRRRNMEKGSEKGRRLSKILNRINKKTPPPGTHEK